MSAKAESVPVPVHESSRLKETASDTPNRSSVYGEGGRFKREFQSCDLGGANSGEATASPRSPKDRNFLWLFIEARDRHVQSLESPQYNEFPNKYTKSLLKRVMYYCTLIEPFALRIELPLHRHSCLNRHGNFMSASSWNSLS